MIEVNKESIDTRRYMEGLVQQARSSDCATIDLSNVQFISRAVADEIVHQMEQDMVEFKGLDGDVEKMIDIIKAQE